MSGSIQSSNYVPGVSGWKLNSLTGDFEINSSNISVGGLPADQQLITITAGEWPDYDLPANAVERYAFIGAELMKIPAEHRDSAEFTTEDFSFDRDGSDYRTTLTYVRRETQEEAKARLEKAKVAGTRIVKEGGCTTIICDGVVRVRYGNLSEPEQPQPFQVVDGKVFISETAIQDSTITNLRVTPAPGDALKAGSCSSLLDTWSVRMELHGGKYVAAGMGLGIDSQTLVSAHEFAIKESSEFGRAVAKGADAAQDLLAQKISELELCKALKEWRPASVADSVREVIREEIRPGGLLHRK